MSLGKRSAPVRRPGLGWRHPLPDAREAPAEASRLSRRTVTAPPPPARTLTLYHSSSLPERTVSSAGSPASRGAGGGGALSLVPAKRPLLTGLRSSGSLIVKFGLATTELGKYRLSARSNHPTQSRDSVRHTVWAEVGGAMPSSTPPVTPHPPAWRPGRAMGSFLSDFGHSERHNQLSHCGRTFSCRSEEPAGPAGLCLDGSPVLTPVISPRLDLEPGSQRWRRRWAGADREARGIQMSTLPSQSALRSERDYTEPEPASSRKRALARRQPASGSAGQAARDVTIRPAASPAGGEKRARGGDSSGIHTQTSPRAERRPRGARTCFRFIFSNGLNVGFRNVPQTPPCYGRAFA